MTEVILLGIYNTTHGLTLVAETDEIIRIGDIIRAGGTDYRVEGFPCLSKAKPDDPVSIVVKPVN